MARGTIYLSPSFYYAPHELDFVRFPCYTRPRCSTNEVHFRTKGGVGYVVQKAKTRSHVRTKTTVAANAVVFSFLDGVECDHGMFHSCAYSHSVRNVLHGGDVHHV